jgi:hypothetical protein
VNPPCRACRAVRHALRRGGRIDDASPWVNNAQQQGAAVVGSESNGAITSGTAAVVTSLVSVCLLVASRTPVKTVAATNTIVPSKSAGPTRTEGGYLTFDYFVDTNGH